MAVLGTVLAKEVLGFDDANKAFRPWWDTTQDFLMYGMVVLGLIVAPAAMIEGTPMICQECFKNNCDFFERPNNADLSKLDHNKSYEWRWVQKYCTSTAIHPLISYFPYVLFLMAFVMIMLEHGFMKIFKAGKKLRIFYNLLVKENQSREKSTESLKPSERFAIDTEDRRCVIEVSHSFTNRHNLYTSYMFRTVLELLLSLGMLSFLSGYGFPLLLTNKFIKCNVYGKYYECVGHPQNFYLIVSGLAIIILGCFVLCSSYTIFWLTCPHLGILSKIMARYRTFIHQQQNVTKNEWTGNTNEITFMDHEMENIYYNNRDIKLLLDLLATCSGVEQSLRILVLFDSKLKSYLCPGDLKFVDQSYHSYIPVNEVNISTIAGVHEETCVKKLVYDLSIEFSEAIIMTHLLRNVKDIVGIYTVEIYPRTPRSTIHKAIKVTPQKSMVQLNSQKMMHTFSTRLYDMDPEQRYAIRVCILINGLRIAQRIEIIKPLNAASLCSLKSSSSNTLTTSFDDSNDNPVIHDITKANQKSYNNVILAPLRISNVNNAAKFRM